MKDEDRKKLGLLILLLLWLLKGGLFDILPIPRKKKDEEPSEPSKPKPDVSPKPYQEPTVKPSIKPSVKPVIEPTPAPVPIKEPTPEPTPEPVIVKHPKPTPVPIPVKYPKPTPEPVIVKHPKPIPTPIIVTPDTTPESTPEPTPKPTPIIVTPDTTSEPSPPIPDILRNLIKHTSDNAKPDTHTSKPREIYTSPPQPKPNPLLAPLAGIIAGTAGAIGIGLGLRMLPVAKPTPASGILSPSLLSPDGNNKIKTIVG